MGLVTAFLNFAFICSDLLAWPLLALVYPLCASIRAIETNSINHMRKLVTYWILFSLISLFELAFVKLIEWVPLWPYIKLGIVSWLVLPQFKGVQYCYETFVHPCLSVNLEEAMSWLYKKHEAIFRKESFLSVAERFVAENGTEALEKLIASKGSRTDFGVEEIKTVAQVEKNETPQTAEVKHADQVLVETEKKPYAAVVKEVTEPAATGETLLPEKAPLEKVQKEQKEWTCAVCQVTTTCEANLNMHLRGMKHKAKCVELRAKATKQMDKNKAAQVNIDSKKCVCDGLSQNRVKQNTKNTSSSGMNYARKCWCHYCDVTCTSELDFKSHLSGKRHLLRVQELTDSAAGVQG